MEKQYISEFKDKQGVSSYFILNKKVRRLTKTDKPYLELGFSDKTGKIEGRAWDNADILLENADTGDVVFVRGSISVYKDENQIKVDHFEKVENGAYDLNELIRTAENSSDIAAGIRSYLLSLKDPWIKKISDLFIEDTDIMTRFENGVGAKSWHNAYAGGLMEHTYEVMSIVEKMSEMYQEADRDILIFGAFLHDIGKIHELDPRKMEYTVIGGLVGHIAIGYKLLASKIAEIEGFPEELEILLEHIILSHHGEYEQQSPVLPKTLEATIIYHADELVSQANAVREIGASQGGENKVWSNFVSIKNRKYYIKSSVNLKRSGTKQADTVSEMLNDDGDDLFG